MQFSRREEAFRYEFPEPISGDFYITNINGMEVESSFGKMEILDLSLNGAQIITEYDFQIGSNSIELTLQFRIMSIEFSIPGIVIHQQASGVKFVCGIHLKTDEILRTQLTDELKSYAWRLVEDKTL